MSLSEPVDMSHVFTKGDKKLSFEMLKMLEFQINVTFENI